jgi:hypothetical protein
VTNGMMQSVSAIRCWLTFRSRALLDRVAICEDSELLVSLKVTISERTEDGRTRFRGKRTRRVMQLFHSGIGAALSRAIGYGNHSIHSRRPIMARTPWMDHTFMVNH